MLLLFSMTFSLQLCSAEYELKIIIVTGVLCAENLFFVFPEMKLHGLVPNSYIHVSVSDLYIPRIGLHLSTANKYNNINLQLII